MTRRYRTRLPLDNTDRCIAMSLCALGGVGLAGFITHIWWGISKLEGSADVTWREGVIMICGVVLPPLGAIHGLWLWFN